MRTIKNICLLILLLHSLTAFSGPIKKAISDANTFVYVDFPESKATDKLILYYSNSAIVTKDYLGGSFKSVISTRTRGGRFVFKLPLDHNNSHPYVVISKLKDDNLEKDTIISATITFNILEYNRLNKGDNLRIGITRKSNFDIKRSFLNNFDYKFSGKGSLKFYLRYKVDSLAYHTDFKSDFFNSDLTYNKSNFEIRKIQSSLSIIEKYKLDLKTEDYLELKNHCIFGIRSEENLLFHYAIKRNLDKLSKINKESILAAYLASNNEFKVPLASSLQSFDFGYAEESKMKIISYLNYGADYKDSLIKVISLNESGKTREKVLLICLLEEGFNLKDYNYKVIEAAKFVQSPEYLPELRKLKRKLIGQPAYNFELPDTSGKIVKLSDFKGKIVFLDFWYTGCGNCIYFYQNELSKAEEKYKNNPNVVFITVSIDKDRAFWIRSVNSGKYTSPSKINLYTGGRYVKDKVIEYYDVHSFPQPMIIGNDQKIYQLTDGLRTEKGISIAIDAIISKN